MSEQPSLNWVWPSGYHDGVAELTLQAEGKGTVFVAAVAALDGGVYALQAPGLGFSPPVPSALKAMGPPRLRRFSSSYQLDRALSRLGRPVRRAKLLAAEGPSIGSRRSLWVDVPGAPSERVEAVVQATSAHAVLYVDRRALQSFPRDKAEQLVKAWDLAYPKITKAFGRPMNENDPTGDVKVYFLFTPALQEGAGVAGFFSPSDLYSQDWLNQHNWITHTNEMNILYISTDPVMEDNDRLSTMAHEFQHLISSSQHVFQRGDQNNLGNPEDPWIDEGLSMLAEDIAGYGFHGKENLGFASQFMVAPGAVSLLSWRGTLADYGAAWLFFRYLADEFGEDAIACRLVQTGDTGVENVEAVTGESFESLLTAQAMAILDIVFDLKLPKPYMYTSLSRDDLGDRPLTLMWPGTVRVNPGGYHFYAFDKNSQPSFVTVTITTEEVKPALIGAFLEQ